MLACSHLVSLFVTLGLLASCEASPVTWSPVISTSKGQISGYLGSSGNRFTLPYAKPPVSSLRFRRPEAIDHFTSAYDGTKLPKACLQQPTPNSPSEQSEDCLYMNIYTPKNAQPTSKLPVFVWVHGGSFLAGSTQDLDGFALANSQNMIVVTVQYRLGFFGWLKYDDWGVEGNMGLRDLIMALQVVQQDIAPFGGDPSLVTLAGQSSGAQMVKALLSTPSASNLFNRAILHSAPLDYSPQSPALANAVGKTFLFDIVGCGQYKKACLFRAPHDNDSGNTYFAQNVTAFFEGQRTLAGLALRGDFGPGVPFAEPFNIVADGDLVTGDGQQILDSNKQIIFTTVKDEGCPSVGQVVDSLGPSFSAAPADYLIQQFYGGRSQAIIDSGLYTSNSDDATTKANNLVQLATDFYWVCPNQEFALSAAAKTTVYLGEFNLGIQSKASSETQTCDGKVGHEDDIAVVFNTPTSSLSSAQSTLVKEVQARWGAFARTGNPNAGSYSTWPALPSTGGLQVLQLGSTSNGGSSLATSQRTEACKLYATA